MTTQTMEGSAEGTDRPSVLVLLSGGVDSAACAAFYRSQRYAVSALFVEYGQEALQQERLASRRVAKSAGIALARVGISGLGPFGKGYIPARNALLLTAALSNWKARKGMIALGIERGHHRRWEKGFFWSRISMEWGCGPSPFVSGRFAE